MIGLKKIMPVSVVCSKAFVINVGTVFMAVIMLFMIFSNTDEICMEKHETWVQV